MSGAALPIHLGPAGEFAHRRSPALWTPEIAERDAEFPRRAELALTRQIACGAEKSGRASWQVRYCNQRRYDSVPMSTGP